MPNDTMLAVERAKMRDLMQRAADLSSAMVRVANEALEHEAGMEPAAVDVRVAPLKTWHNPVPRDLRAWAEAGERLQARVSDILDSETTLAHATMVERIRGAALDYAVATAALTPL